MKKTILDKLLDEDVLFKKNEKENKILSSLLEEINLIKTTNIKSFVRSVLLKAKDFWEMPASMSVDENPIDEHGIGGNVLHTQRVIRLAQHICDSYMLDTQERDLVYAACLLHDVTKAKKDENANYIYDDLHAYTVDAFVEWCIEEDKKYASESSSTCLYVDKPTIEIILRLIRCHMGPWSPIPETYPTSNAEMVVHLADNIASNLHNIVDGKAIMEHRWKPQNEENNKPIK